MVIHMQARRVVDTPRNEGEFQWVVCTKYMDAAEGGRIPMELSPCGDDEHPTHIMLRLPGNIIANLAIRYHGEQQNGHSWEWDGNRDHPTLTPSVNAERPGGGWHGWLTAGEFRSA